MSGIPRRHRAGAGRGAYVARAVNELRSWPALAVRESRRGVAIVVSGTEILRQTGKDAVRLRLTAPAIGRLGPPLRECDQVRSCRDRAWVSVQLEGPSDLELLLALTSVAIKAHAG